MERMAKMRTDFLFCFSLLLWLHRFLLGIAGRKLLNNLFIIPSFPLVHIVFCNGTIRNLDIRGVSEDQHQYISCTI